MAPFELLAARSERLPAELVGRLIAFRNEMYLAPGRLKPKDLSWKLDEVDESGSQIVVTDNLTSEIVGCARISPRLCDALRAIVESDAPARPPVEVSKFCLSPRFRGVMNVRRNEVVRLLFAGMHFEQNRIQAGELVALMDAKFFRLCTQYSSVPVSRIGRGFHYMGCICIPCKVHSHAVVPPSEITSILDAARLHSLTHEPFAGVSNAHFPSH